MKKLIIILLAVLMALTLVSCKDEPDTSDMDKSLEDSFAVVANLIKALNEPGWDAMFELADYYGRGYFQCNEETHIYSILQAGETAGFTLDNSEVCELGLGTGRYIVGVPALEGVYPASQVTLYSSTDSGMDYIDGNYFFVECSLGSFTLSNFDGVDGKLSGIRIDCFNPVTLEDKTINSLRLISTEFTNGTSETEINITDAAGHTIEIKAKVSDLGVTTIEKATFDGKDIRDKVQNSISLPL